MGSHRCSGAASTDGMLCRAGASVDRHRSRSAAAEQQCVGTNAACAGDRATVKVQASLTDAIVALRVDAAEPPARSSSFIPAWLRSKLPAAVGGSREYEQEAQTLTMDKYASTLRQARSLRPHCPAHFGCPS